MTLSLKNLPDRFFRYALNGGHQQVEGWLEPGALTATVLLDELQEEAGVEGALAEIGVHHGRYFIALCLLRRPGQHAVAIDIFEDQALNKDHSGHGNRAILTENLVQHVGSIDQVAIIKADSLATDPQDLERWAGGPVRLFSIDGCHTAEHTLNDIRLAADVLVPGGIIVIDDIFNAQWPGVMQGAEDFFHAHNQHELVPLIAADNKLILCHRRYRERYLEGLRRSLQSALGPVRTRSLFAQEVIDQPFPPLDYLLSPETHARFLESRLLHAVCLTADNHPGYQRLSGWSNAEPWGTWSDGTEARLRLPMRQAANGPLVVELFAHALLVPARPRLTVDPEINGHAVEPWVFEGTSELCIHRVSVPAAWLGGDSLDISFRMSDVRSPLELGVSDDARQLGIGLQRVKIMEAA